MAGFFFCEAVSAELSDQVQEYAFVIITEARQII
jgi:hypothetical protein